MQLARIRAKWASQQNNCPVVSPRKSYLIGIDTGGTYTDAVLIDEVERRILHAEKSITTKGNLALGIGDAMSKVLQASRGAIDPDHISSLSVSTTLATNAVVEGHGSLCAVILIGFDKGMAERTGIAKAFPDVPIMHVGGGHNHNGEQLEKLDEAFLRDQVAAVAGKVSAFSIASAFAVRNAAHELKAREVIADITSKPVTLSSEISSSLDAPRRALTATLNARLIGHITRLVDSVQDAATKIGIMCPIMVVRGNGSLARSESIRSRPIETVLSGPAASLIGAKWLSGLDDFIMSDIGGTTTDVGLLMNGRPQIAANGATVGGWRTMVRAIDITTIGLGGDSEVAVGINGALLIGPQRALPISLLASRRPELLGLLEIDLAEMEGGSMLGKFVVRPFGASADVAAAGLSPVEQDLVEKVSDVPTPLRHVAPSAPAQRTVQSLRRKGLLQYAAFTPSDASHVLGFQSNWNREASEIAAKLLTRFRTMKMPDAEAVNAFCREVWSRTVSLSCDAILTSALGDRNEQSLLINAVCDGKPMVNLAKVSVSPSVPIVAVGGPAKVYYGEVAKRLACDVRFVENFDVANAVGAAVGNVTNVVEATIEGDGQGTFRVYCEGVMAVHGGAAAALDDAKAKASEAARNRALAFGAFDPKVVCTVHKNMLPDAINDDGLMTAVIKAEATGHSHS